MGMFQSGWHSGKDNRFVDVSQVSYVLSALSTIALDDLDHETPGAGPQQIYTPEIPAFHGFGSRIQELVGKLGQCFRHDHGGARMGLQSSRPH